MIDAEPRFVLLMSHMYMTFVVSLLFENLLFMSFSVALMLMALMMRNLHISNDNSTQSTNYHSYLLVTSFITFVLMCAILYSNLVATL